MPLEQSIIDVVLTRGPEGIHGFALAQELSGSRGATRMVAHGTLYKALDRLRRRGLLEATWEDPTEAEAARRPRRRLYTATPAGARALSEARSSTEGALRWGEAPA